MCLQKASEIILGTSVTWAEFESHLRSALGTEARLGACKSVIDIGDGIGFASRCALITCDWVGAKEEEELPKRVVLKIPSSLPFRQLTTLTPPGQRVIVDDEVSWLKMEAHLRELHNTEIASYEFFEQFEGLSLARKYYGSRFEADEMIGGQICLEFVENSRMMNFYERHSVEQLRQVAREIGQVHACSLKRDAIAPELNSDNYINVYNSRTKLYSGLLKGIFTFDSSEKTRELMSKIDEILPSYYDTNLPLTLHKQLGLRPVLVNGDLRTENVLVDAKSGDLAALIDWQCTHFGIGVEDLHRITLFGLSSEDRRVSTSMLVREMYTSMVENLSVAEIPYSLDTLLHLSDMLFPHCALFFASACIGLLATQLKDPSLSDEEKLVRKKIVLDKVIGALEDVLEYDDKNKTSIVVHFKFRSE